MYWELTCRESQGDTQLPVVSLGAKQDSWFPGSGLPVEWRSNVRTVPPTAFASLSRGRIIFVRNKTGHRKKRQREFTLIKLSIVEYYHTQTQTLAAPGLEEHNVRFPDFCVNCQFFVIYCVYFANVLFSKNFWFTIHVDSWFWRIIDWICWACATFRWIPNLEACTDRQTDGPTDVWTDGRTDELIRIGLGNLLVPPRLRVISLILKNAIMRVISLIQRPK